MSVSVEERPPGAKLVAHFSYDEAFSRNLGWLTEWEQQALRFKRVAIAGMGGVGGFHLLTLVRFGIGAFNIADGDSFELVNFNRQAGATLDTIGRSKVAVMAESALQINPELRLGYFDQGLTEANLDAFLTHADLCIDGLDFFALDIRRKLNARCRDLGIPVINAAPLGMGVALLIFMPKGMSFEEWFQLDGLTEEQQYVSYLVGMAPSALHRGYLVDPSRVDLRGHRGPSTVAGCELCAAVAGVEAIKILLRRGPVRAAPCYHQFDAYRGRWTAKRLRGGNGHPVQRLKIALARRVATKLSKRMPRISGPAPRSEIENILDYARWAPSGDNTQPWRFTILADDKLIMDVYCPSDVYEYGACEPTLLSGGFLLESLRIAASNFGRGLIWTYRSATKTGHRIELELPRQRDISSDPLMPHLITRSVDRRPYRTTRLTAAQKFSLAAALGPCFNIQWHEGLYDRWQCASINAHATDIRLRIPETFEIHQRILNWSEDLPSEGIPARTIGLDPVTLRLIRWAMGDSRRAGLLNRLTGTAIARLEMDLIPGILAAAHFTIRPMDPEALQNPSSLLAAGQALQQFWLTATRLGLVVQPTVAPLCFARHSRAGIVFTRSRKGIRSAAKLARKLDNTAGANGDWGIFRGRIGVPRARPHAIRSGRRRAGELWADLEVLPC